MSNRQTEVEQIVSDTLLFMIKRFPERFGETLQLYELPYFAKWCGRFASGMPTTYMDEKSLEIFKILKEEGKFARLYV